MSKISTQWCAAMTSQAYALLRLGRQAPAGSVPNEFVRVPHPNDNEVNRNLHNVTRSALENIRPENTRKQQEPKIQEHLEHCDKVCPDDRYRCAVNMEKLFRFMYYQSYRDKKKTGGRKRSTVGCFDFELYDEVITKYLELSASNPSSIPLPANGMSMSTFSAHRSAIKKLHSDQPVCASYTRANHVGLAG